MRADQPSDLGSDRRSARRGHHHHPGLPGSEEAEKKGKRRKKQPKKHLSAGGFSSTINGVPGAPVMVFGESHLGSPGAWLASATNAVNTPGSVSVTSQGICF